MNLEEKIEPLKKERSVTRRFFTKCAGELEAILKTEPAAFQFNVQLANDATVLHEKLGEHEKQLQILNDKIKNIILATDFDEKTLELELESADLYHSKWLHVNFTFISKKQTQPIIKSDDRSSKNLRLPKLELKTFDGKIKSWLSFWGQFSKIDKDPGMEITDKYQYLLQSMDPNSDVKSLVESYPPTAYNECLEQLKSRYARDELLVQVYVRELLAIVLSKNTNTKISTLFDNLSAHLRALESLGVTKDKYAAFLLPMVESALPPELLKIWERYREQDKETDTDLTSILNFLKREGDSEQRLLIAQNTFSKAEQERKTVECLLTYPQPRNIETENQPSTQTKLRNCIWCEKDTHSSLECYKLHKMNTDERRQHLKEKKACMICLKKGHHAKMCKSFVKCLLCQKRHSTVLCTEQKTTSEGEKIQNKAEPVTSLSTTHQKEEILLQTVMVEVEFNNKKTPVRALFDSGSQRTYIKKTVVEKLDIAPCRKETLSHCLFGGLETKSNEHIVHSFSVNSVDNSFKLNVEALSQDNICGNIPKINSNDVKLNQLLQKHGINVTDKISNILDIGLLIGADYLGFLLTDNIIPLKDGLIAIKSKLGWTLQGKQVSVITNTSHTSILHCNCEKNLTDYWALETLGIQDPAEMKSRAEVTADTLAAFKETIKINKDNRYEVKLPFKTNHEDLLSNFDKTKLRLETLTRKLVTTDTFHDYDKVLKEWANLGIIERIESNPITGHYLPHRPVVKEASITSNIRPVFDASSKDKNGLSLNACLQKGINMIDLIPNLLINFRTGTIGITADIQKAFLQISLCTDDRDYLKFLWWENDTLKNIITYRHCRVVFGLTSSPFLLSATLMHHLNGITGTHAETAKLPKRSWYVDNCVTSLDTEEETLKFIKESKHIMQTGKFNLRMWVTSPLKINESGRDIISVLGLNWDTESDQLCCNLTNLPTIRDNQKITKRELLSLTQRIFDPIGHTSPVLLIPKLILQEAWRRELSWDDAIPHDLQHNFYEWYKHLTYLKDCKVPRKLTTDSIKQCELSLHLFCDASKNGYGCCILLRAEKELKVTVQLILAKSRVTPPKRISIPRLELLAALTGSRLLSQVKENVHLKNCKIYCWTDSSVILCWIKRELPLNNFVGNRIKEIRQHTNTQDWHHIPGTENWADLASRGCTAKTLLYCRWWEGPAWLLQAPEKWPHSEIVINEREMLSETRKTICVNQIYCNHSLLNKLQNYFSKYTKIIRTIAWIFRFLYNTQHANNKRKGEITYNEYEKSEKILIKLIQKENIEILKKDSGKLAMFEDKEGLIRIKTKLTLSDLPENVRTPYLLPAKIPAVKLMVKQRHEQLQHAGTDQLIVDLRARYWIIGIRRLAKSVIFSCTVCRRYQSKPVQVPPAPLPPERVLCAAPFQTTGVDLAGPLYLQDGGKCWIVLYTCAVFRAVHLELTRSLSTEAFIMTLRKFIARRGRMDLIMSDQGTNFYGTKNLISSLDWEEIQCHSTIRRIRWKMNAPTAAWWGGYWERLIRIMKDLLRRIIGNASLTYEELDTIICDCEAVMNGRPLTYITHDNSDSLEPLTPAHFIQPAPVTEVTDIDQIDNKSLNNRLKFLQKVREQFRERFKTEYLTQLVQKAKEVKDELKVGDIVLIDTGEKRIKWPLGIVEKLFLGKDGVERTAQIKTYTGTKIRPVQRLFKLEVSSDSPGKDTSLPSSIEQIDQSEKLNILSQPQKTTRFGRQIKIPTATKVRSRSRSRHTLTPYTSKSSQISITIDADASSRYKISSQKGDSLNSSHNK